MGVGEREMFGFRFRWYDYVVTFTIATAIFSMLWLVDFETMLIDAGIGAAGPLNHEDIGLLIALTSLGIVLACSFGLVKIRKSQNETVARILFYVMLIFACIFWQNLYDLFGRLGLVVYV